MEGIYYTLRKAGLSDRPTFELSKWEQGRVQPLDVYVQWIPQAREGYRFHSCNCPSRSNPCKHAAISLALLNEGLAALPYLYWEEGHLRVARDMASMQQLSRLGRLGGL